MARHGWLTLALIACVSCGGNVVSMQGLDAGMQTQLPPPQRGATDSSMTVEDAGTSPPPVDAPVDVSRPVDVAMPIDRPPDIVTVVDATPDVPLVRCTMATANCPDGMYCSTPACGNNGTCQPLPAGADTAQAPVCGCDRLTYWNVSLAATSGTSVRGDGVCPAVTAMSMACAGVGNGTCPNGSLCNLEQATVATCNQNASGRCWVLPATCPPVAMPTTRRCVGGGGNLPCQSACDLIQLARVFTVDPTCP
jgi:hypothetical protein